MGDVRELQGWRLVMVVDCGAVPYAVLHATQPRRDPKLRGARAADTRARDTRRLARLT
jgi:hypothetical protein